MMLPSATPIRGPTVIASNEGSTATSSPLPKRSRKPPARYGYDGTIGYGYMAQAHEHRLIPSLYLDSGVVSPAAYKTTVTDPDTLTYDEGMAEPEHRAKWLESMQEEIQALEMHGTWDEVDISDAKTKILPGTWVLRRKRTPDGEVRKYKARYCCRGDLEEGDFDTFAPVVAWSSVRLFLVLTMTIGWTTCSIDFANAFLQAKLTTPVWIHLPRGFLSTRPGKTCLRLKRSQYGLSIAPRLWYEHLFAALIDIGLTPSQQDPCLLYKQNLLVVLYVDDAGIAAPDPKIIDEFIAELERRHFKLTREGSFSEFLGIKFTEDKVAGTITLTQKGLINKVIKAAGLEQCNPNWTPASTLALGIDPEGPPMKEDWVYPSIVGMLLYLATNTRPDISFAVSQVARFNHNPKQSHAQAVKMIIRYLSRTKEMGTIVKPSGTLALDCYVDADFAGLYRRDPDSSPSSAKSRLGYIITLGGAPLIWKSQLQSEISLSTQESEYSSLSQSLRSLLPLRSLLLEVTTALGIDPALRSTIHARAFEDNNGAYLLATSQRITNRTKYYLVKWHHFWAHVKDGTLEICKVSTDLQRADGHTKGLNRETFERIRKLNQGW
jgi:hypothetical protein